ncbi:hypothetical protein GC174_02530 [bacterium]|nr:hypothetical protein [bacterium]
MKKNNLYALFALSLGTLALTGCHTAVQQGNNHLANLRYSQKNHPGAGLSDSMGGNDVTNAKANLHEEMEVVEEIRKAWKLATIGKDREGALKILRKLDEEHPGISTVQMMMGQVEEHFGNHKEAAVHYRHAHNVNQFSSLQTYKLAESLRKSGDAKGSVLYYEKLEKRLESAVVEFKRDSMSSLLSSVRLGMAEAMLDSGSEPGKVIEVLKKVQDADQPTKKEVERILDKIISRFPDNDEAKQLLKASNAS